MDPGRSHPGLFLAHAAHSVQDQWATLLAGPITLVIAEAITHLTLVQQIMISHYATRGVDGHAFSQHSGIPLPPTVL